MMNLQKEPVVITGMGIVCPAGIGLQVPWDFVLSGKSACGPLTRFDATGYRCQSAAEISNWDPRPYMAPDIAKRMDKVAQFSLAATQLACADAVLVPEAVNPLRIGVCIGTGLGGVVFTETQLTTLWTHGPKRVHPLTVPNVNPNAVAAFVAMHLQVRGPNMTVSTACASGAHAIGQALMLLETGRADVVIAGGAENPIMPMMFAGFDAMRVMASCRESRVASRPFDADRDGFVIGEGAAVMVLETLAHAKRRQARIYAELAGYGANNGGHHMVTPQPDGQDSAMAMQLAISDAGLLPGDIDYINAHGTSTQANDAAETHAIKSVFGHRAYQIPVSSTKGATGHLIGAAGALEACFSVMALHTQRIPPTANYHRQDSVCDLDYVPVVRNGPLDVVLSNSFGFGNNNACLVFKTHKKEFV